MILDRIVARKREEVRDLKGRGGKFGPRRGDPPRGFARALLDASGMAVIAEAKKASPSKGVIAPDFDPVAIAQAYHAGGAQAMSVLTDVDFFQGSLEYLVRVREAVPLPVLRKDFIIDALQIAEADAAGADAILLIAAILETAQMRDYLQEASGRGLDVLTEVHDEREVEAACRAGARLIGINNRNLRDFSVSLDTTFRVMRQIPGDIPVVSESGIKTHDDVRRLAAGQVRAVLVGESLMREADKTAALQRLMGWA